ncbi:MAG: hypothetical protein AAF791_06190 [Bacteroidota bacterium]
MRLLFCTLLLALGTDALAQHNARYTPTGRVSTTEVSGASDAYRIGMIRNFGADFLHGLTLFEGSGGVCSAEATGWAARRGFFPTTNWRFTDRFEHLTETLGRGAMTATRTVVDCRGNRQVGDAVEADFPRAPRSGPAGPIRLRGHNGTTAISGVRVCTDGSEDGGIRGVTLALSTINEGGNGQVERSGQETIRLRGCSDWQRMRSCRRGQVATGMDLHYASVEGQRADVLTGIALRCQRVQITPIG